MPTRAQIDVLMVGMAEAEIVEAIGYPEEILNPNATSVPGALFRSLGSIFQFSDESLDAIWVYRHSVRRKLMFCLGMKAGCLKAKWRLTETGPRNSGSTATETGND